MAMSEIANSTEKTSLAIADNGGDFDSNEETMQEEEKHTETRKERYERLLKRILGYRRVMRLDASPGGYHAGDFEAARLHKVQEQWYACLDMALAQAERALMGMIETETQYGRVCDD